MIPALILVAMTSIVGTQISGCSLNKIVCPSIALVAYNPFPQRVTFIAKPSGMINPGVCLDIAAEADVKTPSSCLPSSDRLTSSFGDNTFLILYNQWNR